MYSLRIRWQSRNLAWGSECGCVPSAHLTPSLETTSSRHSGKHPRVAEPHLLQPLTRGPQTACCFSKNISTNTATVSSKQPVRQHSPLTARSVLESAANVLLFIPRDLPAELALLAALLRPLSYPSGYLTTTTPGSPSLKETPASKQQFLNHDFLVH